MEVNKHTKLGVNDAKYANETKDLLLAEQTWRVEKRPFQSDISNKALFTLFASFFKPIDAVTVRCKTSWIFGNIA